jgi:hypothetical protein
MGLCEMGYKIFKKYLQETKREYNNSRGKDMIKRNVYIIICIVLSIFMIIGCDIGIGLKEINSGETGSGDTGSGETGSEETGSGEAGSGDTGSGDTGTGDTGSGETGSGDTSTGDTGIKTNLISKVTSYTYYSDDYSALTDIKRKAVEQIYTYPHYIDSEHYTRTLESIPLGNVANGSTSAMSYTEIRNETSINGNNIVNTYYYYNGEITRTVKTETEYYGLIDNVLGLPLLYNSTIKQTDMNTGITDISTKSYSNTLTVVGVTENITQYRFIQGDYPNMYSDYYYDSDHILVLLESYLNNILVSKQEYYKFDTIPPGLERWYAGYYSYSMQDGVLKSNGYTQTRLIENTDTKLIVSQDYYNNEGRITASQDSEYIKK